MWYSSGTPNDGAEVPEKNERRGPPEGTRAGALAEGGQRLLHRGAIDAGPGLVHGPGGGGEREGGEERDQEEGPAVGHVRREVAAGHPRHEAGPVDRRPLNGLEARRQAARLALLDHHGVAEDVGEGEPEAREPEDRERRAPGIRREQAEGEPAQRGHGGRHEEIGPPAVAQERDQVRRQPVEGLHVPGEADERQERRRLGGAEPHLVLQQEEEGLGCEPGLRLGETLDRVDGGEEDQEPPERHPRPGTGLGRSWPGCRGAVGHRPAHGWAATIGRRGRSRPGRRGRGRSRRRRSAPGAAPARSSSRRRHSSPDSRRS